MKKILLVFVLFLLVGCGSDSSDIVQDINPDLEGVPHGTIAINFHNSNSKSLTNSEAKAESDTYEVVAFNSDTIITGHSDTLTTELSVPVGEYKLIVLAGIKGGLGTQACLLGTSMETGIVVTDGNRTDVVTFLDAVESDFSVPEEVICGRTYQVTASGSTNTGVLEIRNPFLKIGNDDTLNNMAFSQTGVDWSIYMDLTAPGTPGTAQVKLALTVIYLNAPDENINQNLSKLTYYDWKWRYDLISMDFPDSPIYNETIKTVTFIEDPTGIGLDVSWNE